jgi:hypothetical protein
MRAAGGLLEMYRDILIDSIRRFDSLHAFANVAAGYGSALHAGRRELFRWAGNLLSPRAHDTADRRSFAGSSFALIPNGGSL